MAAPTIVKSYGVRANQRMTSNGNNLLNGLNVAYIIKESLKSTTWGANAAVVKGSSIAGGSSYSVGGASPVDYWTSPQLSGYNAGVNPFKSTWIVLQFPATGAQILMGVCGNTSSLAWATFKYSPGGLYTGGSTSALPTASDEINFIDAFGPGGTLPANNPYNPTLSATADYLVHQVQSTDGKEIAIYTASQGVTRAMISIRTLTNALAGWATNSFIFYNPNNTGFSTLSSATSIYTRISGTNYGLYPTGEIFGSTSITAANIADEDTGTFPAAPIGVMSLTSPKRGRKGAIADAWWVSTGGEGATYPIDGSKQFVQFGDLLVPWDGTTVPQMA